MALTKEQIKNLKPGDPIIIHGTFEEIFNDGDIMGRIKVTAACGEVVDDHKYMHPSCVSLPQENMKRDPYRLFRKGDIVRLKEWNGRCPEMYSGTNSWFDHPPRCKNGNLEVREDEKNSMVEIGIIDVDCAHATAAPCYLELVTPVEEIEPYKVWDTTYGYNVGVEDTTAVFYYSAEMSTRPYTKEQAKSAAEAECDRLNEEWRKNKNNA